MADPQSVFREKLPAQAEVCARKTLEWLQKDLQSLHVLEPIEVYYLAHAASILLIIRDTYGEE
jgi:hypothetical protein